MATNTKIIEKWNENEKAEYPFPIILKEILLFKKNENPHYQNLPMWGHFLDYIYMFIAQAKGISWGSEWKKQNKTIYLSQLRAMKLKVGSVSSQC